MFDDAPGRLSTTTDWPKLSVSFFATQRATTSVLPPGAKPTTSRTGLTGYDCDHAGATDSASAKLATSVLLLLFIFFPLVCVCAAANPRRQCAGAPSDDFRLGGPFFLGIADNAFRLVSLELRLRMAEPIAEDGVVAGAQRQAGLDRPALGALEDQG